MGRGRLGAEGAFVAAVDPVKRPVVVGAGPVDDPLAIGEIGKGHRLAAAGD